eukprot:2156576-Rhodomonas_salina.1
MHRPCVLAGVQFTLRQIGLFGKRKELGAPPDRVHVPEFAAFLVRLEVDDVAPLFNDEVVPFLLRDQLDHGHAVGFEVFHGHKAFGGRAHRQRGWSKLA